MTNKDARKLNRAELLELLIEQTAENERLARKNAQLAEKLSQRELVMEQAGSIADAAIGLSNVFAQAQDAADRYLESIRRKQEEAERILNQAQQKAQALLQQTQAECQELERQTREKCEALLKNAGTQTAGEAFLDFDDDFADGYEDDFDAGKPAAPRGSSGRFLRR